MIAFLKIISFPVRLVIFLMLATVSGIIFSVIRTFGIILLSAGSIASTLIQLAAGMFSVLVIIDLISLFTDSGTAAFTTPVKDFILLGISLLISLFGAYMPIILEFIVGLTLTISDFLWTGAKKTLFCK